jgi:hypothetical protein
LQFDITLGLGVGLINKTTKYNGDWHLGLQSGWGSILKCKGEGDNWSENYRGQFVDGEKLGWGIYSRPSDGVSLKTCWKNHNSMANKDAKVFDKAGNLLFVGKTRKCIGRGFRRELGSSHDGLIGCLYDGASGVLRYVGKVSYKSMKEFEFGASVGKVGGGWRCQFGLWKDGVL